MKYLLVYKGSYLNAASAPELRNINIARVLLSYNHRVTFAAKSAQPGFLPEGCSFVKISHWWALLRTMLTVDVIILHGGGPLLLLLSLFASFAGKRLVLDAYAPRWIELDAEEPPV